MWGLPGSLRILRRERLRRPRAVRVSGHNPAAVGMLYRSPTFTRYLYPEVKSFGFWKSRMRLVSPVEMTPPLTALIA